MLPSATAFDAAGNLYFAETGNHVVRKVTSAGIITTVAGNGVQGFAGDGGLATSAELDSPAGLALDAAGDLYIADSHNQRIREVNAATGIIATIAGTGAAGFSGDGGAATAAKLDLPTALAFDTAGNLYLADTNNHRVRRIAAATGAITTIAGNGVEAFTGDNGPATSASIDSPNGLALDAAGNLYIADTHNGRVREVSAASGLISTVAGAGVVGGNAQSFGGDRPGDCCRPRPAARPGDGRGGQSIFCRQRQPSHPAHLALGVQSPPSQGREPRTLPETARPQSRPASIRRAPLRYRPPDC